MFQRGPRRIVAFDGGPGMHSRLQRLSSAARWFSIRPPIYCRRMETSQLRLDCIQPFAVETVTPERLVPLCRVRYRDPRACVLSTACDAALIRETIQPVGSIAMTSVLATTSIRAVFSSCSNVAGWHGWTAVSPGCHVERLPCGTAAGDGCSMTVETPGFSRLVLRRGFPRADPAAFIARSSRLSELQDF